MTTTSVPLEFNTLFRQPLPAISDSTQKEYVPTLGGRKKQQALGSGHAVFESMYQMDSLSLFTMSDIENPTHLLSCKEN